MTMRARRKNRPLGRAVSWLCGSVGLLAAFGSQRADALAAEGVVSEKYNYQVDNVKFEGLLTRPPSKQSIRGGVLIVHNWMGVSAETQKQAERFAKLGFVALAADIYGAGVRPKDATEAGKLASLYKNDRALFRKRLGEALAQLRLQKNLDGKPLFAAGYCFGGTGVLELARSGAAVAGVLSFHGGLDSPEPAAGARIKASVVAFHGADDPFVPATDLAAFEKEMATNRVDWQLVKFGGAVHSFTDVGAGSDPSKGAAYNAHADARSWSLTEVFLNEWTSSKGAKP